MRNRKRKEVCFRGWLKRTPEEQKRIDGYYTKLTHHQKLLEQSYSFDDE